MIGGFSMGKKRGNGSGCVCRRKDLKNDQWVAYSPAVYEFDRKTQKAKAKRIRIGTFPTAAKARAALEEYLRMPSDRFNMTLQDAYDEWSGREYEKAGKASVASHKAAWKKVPEWMRRMKMKDIRTAMYQQIIDDYADMSKSSLNNIKILLMALCKYAEQNDVIAKNYAEFIDIPQKTEKEKSAFTEIELEKIRQAVGVVPYADVIYLLCYTGFRINELLTMTRFAYDAECHTLTGGLKTKAGKSRVVPLADDIVCGIVESWVGMCGETIICRPDGKPWSYETFKARCYYPALRQIGVRELTPHACRHTAITRAAKADLRPEEMMRIFGHANYDIEAKTYIHPDIDTLKEAMRKVK